MPEQKFELVYCGNFVVIYKTHNFLTLLVNRFRSLLNVDIAIDKEKEYG